MQRTDEFNKLLADKLLIGAIGASIIILLAECVVPGPVPPVLVIKMDTKEQVTPSDSKSVSSTEIQK